jgi:tetratricopeptide (TPR) repeat protein
MELVEGESLYDRPPASLEETVGIACQVCAALEHAHAHDIVHRDLKPENVLLAADGTARLVDFGLARTVASRLTTEGAILGTIYYLAPEQVQGGEIDGRADLYALGVMLYEWATGCLPFEDAPPAVILSHHLHTPVIPPREHDDEIPPPLDALILQLLSKRRENRPASAAEVRGALEALGKTTAPAEPAGEGVRLPGFLRDGVEDRVDQRPAFVAREGELAWLDGFLLEALGGQGRVVSVTGGPGRGKTALLDAFSRQAMEAHPDLLVAGGTCNAYSGVGDPYLPFREVLGLLTGDVEARWAAGIISRDHALRLWRALPAVIEALLAHGPHVLPALLPGEALLSRVETACPSAPWMPRLRERLKRDGSKTDGLEQRHLFQQVSNVLQSLSETHPLLLILDDLQWVDRTSAGLLFHLGRRLEGSRILVVGAYRPEELAPGPDGERHPLDKLLAEFKRLYGDVWLDLAETNEPEGRRFVEELLETEPNRLGEGFRQALVERAGGHPLFTVELLRAMQERGDLVRDEAGRWVEGSAIDWERLPARVEGVIGERIERLGEELREILTVACVEGEDFTAEVVAQVRAVEARELVRRLSGELQTQHRLVRARGLRRLDARRLALYRFQHHLFQKYLYNHLDEAERAYLHEEVGTVLEALYGGQTDEVAGQLARHFLEAGATDKAAHYFGRAGELAAERYANEEALAHLGQALALLPETDRATRYGLLLAREQTHDLLGQREAQGRDLAGLEALAPELGPEQQAEVAVRRSLYAMRAGDLPASLAAAQVALERAQVADHAGLQAMAYSRWGLALHMQCDYAAAQTQFEAALSLAQTSGLRDIEARALSRLAQVRWLQGDWATGRDYYEHSLRVYRQTSDRAGELKTLEHFAHLSCDLGGFEGAWERLDRCLAAWREMGHREGDGFCHFFLAHISCAVGNYVAARGYFKRALQIGREIEERMLQWYSLTGLAQTTLHLGDYADAREYTEKALSIVREVGSAGDVSRILNSLGELHRAQGRLDMANDCFEEALRLARQIENPRRVAPSLAGLADAALALGDPIRAQAHAAEILTHLQAGLALPFWGRPFWIRLTCYRVFQASGDPRAVDFLQQTYDLLMEYADGIGDEAMRNSFLENVPWHREIVALTRGVRDPIPRRDAPP